MKVNVFGFIDKALGLGQSARISIDAFDSSGIACTAFNIRNPYIMTLEDHQYQKFLVENPNAPINLIHMNPDCLHEIFDKSPSGPFYKKYNIGFWFWETDVVPKEWHYAYDLVDEIWVGSDFNYELFKQSCDLPVIKMPTAIEVNPTLTKTEAKAFFGLSNKFVFLACFDFNSSIKRKNPQATIEAFKAAFPGNDDVRLVFKTQHAVGRGDNAGEEFMRLISDDPRIIFIDKAMTQTEMANLKNACDCYVSLHRSEGFGLNIAESMSLGKPVIVTNFSGNLEFNNKTNSFLVDYHIVSMKPGDYYCATDEMHWAEPSVDHAVTLMKNIYTDYEKAIEIGEKAKIDMAANFNRQKVATHYKKRIEEIYKEKIK